jgi:hypothetical protein
MDLFGILWFVGVFFGLYMFLFKSNDQWAWLIPLIMLLGASLIVYFNLKLGKGVIQTLELKGNTVHITHGRHFLKYSREIEVSSFSYEEIFPSNAITGKDILLKERLAVPIVNNTKWIWQVYKLDDLERFIKAYETGANIR